MKAARLSFALERVEDLEHRNGSADAFSLAFTRNTHLPPVDRLYIARKAAERVSRARPGHVGIAVALEARRPPVIVDELQPGRDGNLRAAAELAAEPIAARHELTVPAVFGPSQTRLVTAARDELCAALLDQGWSPADVARALGLTRGAPGKSARRHWSRIATVATRRTAHVG